MFIFLSDSQRKGVMLHIMVAIYCTIVYTTNVRRKEIDYLRAAWMALREGYPSVPNRLLDLFVV